MTNLNYRHLFYFWMVAKSGNLTRVAGKLRLSQSALSFQIKQLEIDIGQALFLREHRKLSLTEVGRLVLGYADAIFALGNELVSTLNTGEGQAIQQLHVGSVATLSRNFQDAFLRPALKLPNIHLFVESGSLPELLGRLSMHKLHLVLSNRLVGAAGEQRLHCRRLARQQVCLVGPPRSPKRAFKFPDDLVKERLVLPGYTTDVRSSFDLLCESMGIKINVLAEVDDMAMLRLLARNSGAIALVPAVVVQDELRSGELQQYCVVPKVYENFYAITSERRFQPKVLKELLVFKNSETSK